MINYFMKFQIIGEVADMLFLDGPEPRLLVDVSVDPAGSTDARGRRHPTRTCFSLFDKELIVSFQDQVEVGDIINANGSFSQADYIPHRTSHIDTTFHMLNFQRLRKPSFDLMFQGRVVEPAMGSSIH